ncbi:hypothetical protein J2T17_005211 [Paenibacillus mucilaginosus]|uniref:S-layer homology domain-containing protein n=1 Tax=Paenibacillus mucilaginosus TaxID=61624 RepID=UPI003D1F3B4E
MKETIGTGSGGRFRRMGLLVLLAAAAGGGAGWSGVRAAENTGAAELSDIRGHWAEQPITAMTEEGIIGGYPDGTFRPEGTVTRAQFLKLVVTAAAKGPLPDADGAVFGDVPAEHWAASYVSAALKEGIIAGGDAGSSLRPEEEVTRAEMAVLLARALKLKVEPEAAGYADNRELPEAGWIGAAARAGIVSGFEDGTFRPAAPATRAQAAVMIARMVEYLDTGTAGAGQAGKEDAPGDGTELLDPDSLSVGRLHGTDLFLGMPKKEVRSQYGAPLSRGASEGGYTLEYPRILKGRMVTLHFPYIFDELEEECVKAYSLELDLPRAAITGRLGKPESEGEDEAYGGYFLFYRFGMYEVFFHAPELDSRTFTMKVIDKS